MNPRPTAAEIGAFYPTEQYHPFRVIKQTRATKPNRLHQTRAKKISQIQNNYAECRVLDVGCGTGLFLLAMKERGWHVYGVEPNEQASHFARNSLNLPVLTGDIFDIKKEASFAAITLWDVLEHTHSPRDVLLEANRLLAPNGIIAMNVPNWASWERQIFKEKWIALDAPRHLYHFSPNTLKKMLQGSGFDVIALASKTPVMSPASNLLRAFGSIIKSKKIRQDKKVKEQYQTQAVHPSLFKKSLIRATYLALTIPNAMANALLRGGSFTIYARKRGYEKYL